MPVSYSPALQGTRMMAVVSAIDANAFPGTIEIGTAGMASVLVAITLGKPSFAIFAGSTIEMIGAPKNGIAVRNGIAAAARIKDGAGSIVVSGLTVGLTDCDINLSSISIVSGQTVTLLSGALTHAP